MKFFTPKSLLFLFAFLAFAYALPAPEHLVARAFTIRYYIIWWYRRFCIIIIYIYQVRCLIRRYDGTPATYAAVLQTTANWQASIYNATVAQKAIPSGQTTVEDGQQVVDYLTSDYQPQLSAAISEIIGQRSAILSAGHNKAFGAQFRYVQGNQSILNQAVLASLPNDATVRSGAQAAINKINNDLSGLVAAFA